MLIEYSFDTYAIGVIYMEENVVYISAMLYGHTNHVLPTDSFMIDNIIYCTEDYNALQTI